MKYFNAFDAAGYHSAFLTTYAFSVGAFEDTVLPRLRNSGCRNLHLLADVNMVNAEFSEFGAPRYAGTLYHLIKARPPGRAAFHPKIVLQLGSKKARLLVGSANLTGPGLAGNLEIVTEITCDSPDAPAAPLLRHALDYIVGWAPEDAWLREAAEKALERTPVLRSAPIARSVVLSAPSDTLGLLTDAADRSILDQLELLVREDDILRLIVISPYWDKKLRGLRELSARTGSPSIHLLLDPDVHTFTPEALGELAPTFHRLNKSDKRRFPHAKLILAEGVRADHLVTGSVNCSWPALSGLTHQSGNAEAAIYRRLPPGTALSLLDLGASLEESIDPSDLTRPELSADTDSAEPLAMDGGKLIARFGLLDWVFEDSGLEAVSIRLSGANAEVLDPAAPLISKSDRRWRVVTTCDIGEAIFGEVDFAGGGRSAPVVVDHIDALRRSSTTKELNANRHGAENLAHLVDEDLEIHDCFMRLQGAEHQVSEARAAGSMPRVSTSPDEGASETGPLSYAEFVRRRSDAKSPTSRPSLVAGRPVEEVSRVLDRLIGLMFQRKNEQADVELLDAGFDLDTTEVGVTHDDVAEEEDGSVDPSGIIKKTPKAAGQPEVAVERRKRNKAMALKLVEAVAAFEERLVGARETGVTAFDLIRLRTLLQLISAFGTPIGADASDARPLPCWSQEANGWPRLMGRVIHGVLRLGEQPFGELKLEGEIAKTPEEIIAAWGASLWCAHAASWAAQSTPEAQKLRPMLDQVRDKLCQTIVVSLGGHAEDLDDVLEFAKVFGDRFTERLQLSGTLPEAFPSAG